MPGHDPLRLKAEEMKLSFDLSTMAAAVKTPNLSLRPDGSPRDAQHLVSAHIEWQFCKTFQKLFALTNADVARYTASFCEIGGPDELLRIDLCVPDDEKLSIEAMRGVYNSMDSFVKRLLKEVTCADHLYAQDDYACGKQVHLYHTPQEMISTLNRLIHTKYKGNVDALAHVHMARHLLDWREQYAPAVKLN